MPIKEKRRLGDILVSAGVISQEELEQGLEHQKGTNKKLGRALIDEDIISGVELAAALSSQLNIPYVRLTDYELTQDVTYKIPERIARECKVLALKIHDDELYVAMANPLDVATLDQVRMLVDLEVQPVVAPERELKQAIDRAYGQTTDFSQLVEEITEQDIDVVSSSTDEMEEDVESQVNETPVVKYVNMLLLEAIKHEASDIHLEPFEHKFVVRRRIDGILHELDPPPKEFQSAIISRIKVMADLDIAETRLPQDGRFKVELAGREVDFRVSTFPTVYGESVVLRVLHQGNVALQTDKLGMTSEQEEAFRRIVRSSNGIVLVTGRTNSGKTTTLYSGLNFINSPDKKIITLEDPIEYQLPGLIQTQVNEATGYTFASGMRAMLRQDPDVCLVGEIRDDETAQIAVQASLTGHLVLSTTHTNQAAGAVTRLLNMGVEPFLLGSTLQAVMGQCLVRLICENCREDYEPDPDDLRKLGKNPTEWEDQTFTRGTGCEECGQTGYRSRTGIFELLEITPEIVRLINEDASSRTIYAHAVENGMLPLYEHGWKKVIDGQTTVEEVLRVAPAESLTTETDEQPAESDARVVQHS